MNKQNPKNFKPYDLVLLRDIVEHPRDHCKDPYQLLTSYLVNCIADIVDTDNIWKTLAEGKTTVPATTFDKYIADCASDFQQAGINGTAIKIKNEGFTIRKINTVNFNNVPYIFQFPILEGEGRGYLLQFINIHNIKSDFLTDYDERKDQYELDKLYFKRVMVTALDDQNNGWDKLTDMEVAIYCWANSVKKIKMSKRINEEWIPEWYRKNYNCLESITLKEIQSCFRSEDTEDLNTMYPFSEAKVRLWNKNNNQESVVDQITEEEANNIWFNLIRPKFKRPT